jgi:hypothetical protein
MPDTEQQPKPNLNHLPEEQKKRVRELWESTKEPCPDLPFMFERGNIVDKKEKENE